MKTPPRLCFLLTGLILAASLTGVRAQDAPTNQKLILRSLVLLEEQLRSAKDEETKKKTGQSILEVGAPLVAGAMKPGDAASVAQVLKTGTALPAEQQGYFGFWMLRAIGAIQANDETAGQQAGEVLKKLGAADSDKTAVLDVMAALHIKGWLSEPGSPARATKDAPFVNSLGMKFVPVPIIGGPTSGKKILFSVWDTRVKDFQAFIEASAYDYASGEKSYTVGGARWKQFDGSWKDPHFKQTPDHPVVCVSWEDATAFCKWLSQKEGKVYRLPSDHEWSCAVGIGSLESASKSPDDKGIGIEDVYPWGGSVPPPKDAGNYGGGHPSGGARSPTDDGYPFTSPVGSFKANRYGLFDMGGNVWQWCEDWSDRSKEKYRVLRGGAWQNFVYPLDLLSCWRDAREPRRRVDFTGFRLVLVVPGG